MVIDNGVGSSGPVFLTYPAKAGSPSVAMGVKGRLLIEDSCFYVKTQDARFLVYFPSDTASWSARDRTIFYGGKLLRSGDEVSFRGLVRTDTNPISDSHSCQATNLIYLAP